MMERPPQSFPPGETAADSLGVAVPPPPAQPMVRRRRARALQVMLLAVIATALLLWVDLRSVWSALSAMPPALLAGALLVATADRFLMGLKWRQLIRTGGGRLPLLAAVSAYYQSAFSGRILPIGVGQDVLRGYIVVRAGVPAGLVLGSMAVEKLVAVLANVLVALLGVAFLASRLPADTRNALIAAALAVVAIATGGLLLVMLRSTHRLGGRILRGRLLAGRVPERVSGALRRGSRALLAFRGRPGALAVHLLLALAEQGLQVLKFLVLGLALGVELAPAELVATIAVVLFARRATAYLEGWGLAEATSVVLFALLGVDRNTAVALALANYAVMLVATLPGGYLLYRARGRLRPPLKVPR